jgi:predicted dehydrogenase
MNNISTFSKKLSVTRPIQLGFAGVGWIGRNRLEAAVASGLAEVAVIADPVPEAAEAMAALYPASAVVSSFEKMLDLAPDGVVIATPSALHAAQSIQALERGIPVFCQKPLGRNAVETQAVCAAASRADRLLGVDLSYRQTRGMQVIRELINDGELGRITAVEAVFHNAYGPDKEWFYSRKAAGGGCLLDLGIHLVDLALWALDFPELRQAHGWTRESERGEAGDRVEDHAAGLVRLAGGTSLQLACSWGSHAGCDAEIRLQFFGTKGGAIFQNVGGSFYDFTAIRLHPDRSREVLSDTDGNWGGRAIVEWLRRLDRSETYDPDIGHLGEVAEVLDRLYLDSLSHD